MRRTFGSLVATLAITTVMVAAPASAVAQTAIEYGLIAG
jgi:hypothetical protein